MSFQYLGEQVVQNDSTKTNEKKENEKVIIKGTSMMDDYKTFTGLLTKYKTLIILVVFAIFLMNSNIFQNIFYILGALFIYMNISKVVNLRDLLRMKPKETKENFIVLPPPKNRRLY